MQVTPTTAQILLFPLDRVRPGIRQHLNALRRCIKEAEQNGSWDPAQSDITPAFVAGLIPSLENLFQTGDAAVSEVAAQVSILTMHAIQGGNWPREDLLGDLLELQHTALEIEAKESARRTA